MTLGSWQWLLTLAALVASSPVAAQHAHSTEWRTKPANASDQTVGGVEAARALIDYGRCVVGRRYARARAAVLTPLGSAEQARLLDRVAMPGEDTCVRSGFGETRLEMGQQAMAGALAQALIMEDYPQFPSIVQRYRAAPKSAAPPAIVASATEMFGRCLVERDPSSAFALISSRAGSDEEEAAIGRLRDDLSPCLPAGTTVTLAPLSLRYVSSVAAYRLAHQIAPPAGAGTETR